MNEQIRPIVEYIQKQMATGAVEANIRIALQQHGWPNELVEQAFDFVSPPQQQPKPNDPMAWIMSKQPYVGEVQPQEWGPPVQPGQQAPFQPSPTQGAFNPSGATGKYGVLRAFGDSFKAGQANLTANLLAVIVCYLLAVVTFIITTAIISVIGGALSSSGNTSAAALMALIVVTLLFCTIWYVVVGGFIQATLSTLLHQARIGQLVSLGAAFGNSLKLLPRIVVANTLLTLIVIWPAALVALLPVALSLGGVSAIDGVIPLFVLAGLAWVVVMLRRLALAPYLVIFEPEMPVSETRGQSNQLLANGGKWFVSKVLIIVLVFLFILALATGGNIKPLEGVNSIALNSLLMFILIIANGILVMLYSVRRGSGMGAAGLAQWSVDQYNQRQ